VTDYQTGVAPDVTGSDTDDVFTFALSFSQRRLWLIDQLDPGNPAYNIPAAVRFEGPLDIDALEQAVNDVVGHHESLRTNVLVLEGEPRQVVSDMRRIAVRRLAVDAGTLAAARRHIDEETLAPFDLARDPLLRVRVIRLAEADHVVHLTIHHIVSDGWSMGVLVKEISEAYAARSRGMDPALPPLAIQYGDYAEWQREWLAGDVLERLLAYWREKLAPPLALLNLPIDHARGALQTFRGASAPFALPARETGALAAFARSEGATLFMVLLAAFKSLLFRYTGQDDLLVGSPIANRGRRELEPLIGFFVNTLVLRTRLSGDMPFRALLRDIRETTLEAYAHQDLPFEQLVEALQPDRSLSRTPLFQVLFALQNTPVVPAAAGGALVSPLELESTTAKFDLSVSLTETPDGLRGAAEFNTDLFERATIERFVGHYRTILDAVLAAPDTAIGRVPLLTDADRRSLRDWNRSDVDRPGPHTLHELIEQRASETPHRPAVRFQFETLSYDELNRRANQLAHYLSREGIGTEAVVGVSLERSIDLIVALLAVLKSGAAYLPLDPTYPAERLKGMVQDAGATRVVTWRALQPVLDLDPAMLVCVDELRPLLDLQPVANPAPLLDGDNAAYVIFTSGSTGRPKGAVNTHAAIVNRLRWMQEEYRVSPDDRFLQKTPFGFDVSVWEIFAPLVSGACLVVAKPDGHKDPAYLTELIDAEQVTIAHFVPSMLRAFLAAPRTSKCPSLVRVFCSGEALPADLQRGFFEAFDAELSNLYGPTEAAVEVTFWRCRRGDTSALVPIGRPVANTRIHIVDESFSLVPVGIAGELLIGGAALARGYVGQPALTAERFIPNPFDADGERLYRTGDRARWSPDGQVEFLGRLDFQIKIRGFRIEAGEIEARLGDDPNVAAALVIGREVRPDDVRLVAYLVASTGGSINIQELRSQLGARLPEYMVPAAFVVLPALPLLASGKVDRAALPESRTTSLTWAATRCSQPRWYRAWRSFSTSSCHCARSSNSRLSAPCRHMSTRCGGSRPVSWRLRSPRSNGPGRFGSRLRNSGCGS
jgi:amino acid adenylation domain-containing protein